MPTAALIVVNYRTAPLAINAIRSARNGTNVPLQVIVVDNSLDPYEAEALRPHADLLVVSETNLGYAAAINGARKHCDAESLIVSNPDVVFEKGAIDRLATADAAVAGPALYWDDGGQWLLPPSELHTTRELLDRAVAVRMPAWARARDRRRTLARIAFWSLEGATRVRALSGAVLAIRTTAFDAAGGFDERFRLYFEEDDFLRRVRGDVVYVPLARCRHIYNQSAAGSAEAAALYAQSERAYLAKWGGGWAASLAKNIKAKANPAFTPVGDEPLTLPPGTWIEASPLPDFDRAAGHRAGSASVQLPAAVWESYRGTTLYLRAVDPATGNVLARYVRTKIGS